MNLLNTIRCNLNKQPNKNMSIKELPPDNGSNNGWFSKFLYSSLIWNWGRLVRTKAVMFILHIGHKIGLFKNLEFSEKFNQFLSVFIYISVEFEMTVRFSSGIRKRCHSQLVSQTDVPVLHILNRKNLGIIFVHRCGVYKAFNFYTTQFTIASTE